MHKLEEYFPYEKIRPQQKFSIENIVNYLQDKDKKFFILEAGTGIGKSAIGLTAADILLSHTNIPHGGQKGSYILTTQKILQEQYYSDFKNSKQKLKKISSSSNYRCKFHKKNSCAESLRALKCADRESKFFKTCSRSCLYKNKKAEFIHGTHGITNFSYFLAETYYSKKILPRQILVIDEAHNVEEELSRFIEIVISENFVKKIIKISIPILKSQYSAVDWIEHEYLPRVQAYYNNMEKNIEKILGSKSRLKEFEKTLNHFEIVDKHICKIKRFIKQYDPNNWVFDIINARGKDKNYKKIQFKPIDVSEYANEFLFKHAEKIILMSATILSKNALCESLGISKNNCGFLQLSSPFKKEKRPIYFFPIGHMNKRNIDNSLPKLKFAIKHILEQHRHEKGVIHCHTYKIANFIKKNIRNKRLLIHNSDNREAVLKKHLNSKMPTVLLSPSMTEGVDLKNELSRFQIICKIPYPYLGDSLVQKRMKKWDWWYSLQTTKKIVQSTGRSVRNENDYAVTYILDADWEYFYKNNKHYFPHSFKEAIQHVK